ncbi:MAG: non-ribosomal peptide synthetase [Bacteriovoracaceae bacterium]
MTFLTPTYLIKKNAVSLKDKNAIYYKRWYTYSDLSELVNKTAFFLLKNGFKKDQGIPLYFDPCIESLVLIYAISQIGAYYVPFNSLQPISLIKQLIEEFEFKKIICLKNDIKHFQNSLEFNLEYIESFEKTQHNEDGKIAYQLFTSGTTGSPKGVVVSKDNLEYFIEAMDLDFPCFRQDVLIWTTSWTFDVSVAQLYGFLLHGGSLIIPSTSNKKVLINLPNLINDFSITHLDLSPTVLASALKIWTNEEITKVAQKLKYLLIAGEEFKFDLAIFAKRNFKSTKVMNLYGPTETTVFATKHEITGDEKNNIPIGVPLKGSSIKIINPMDFLQVKDGEIGEILIGGKGVAIGYAKNVNLTSKKFFELNNVRYYSTGDYGRINNKGEIEFLGRRDRQVQIHGIRVELSEIESKLITLFNAPGQVRVIYDDPLLHLFYISENDKKKEIQSYLESYFPTYSIPSSYIMLREFPITSSGKLDETKLRKLIVSKDKSKTQFTNTKPIELEILEVFQLSHDNIHDQFKNLSIDSLEILIGISKLEKKFGISVPESMILGSNTPYKLSNYIESVIQNVKEPDIISENITKIDIDHLAKSIQSLWKQSSKVIFKKNEDLQFLPHPLQRLYYYDKFESCLSFRMSFSTSISTQKLESSILSLIKANQLLHSYFIEPSENKLELIESLTFPLNRIPQVKLNQTQKNSLKTIDIISEALIECDKKIVTNEILHTPLILILNDSIELIWTLSHLICDQSSIFILKKAITNELEEIYCNNNLTYTDFIKFQKEKSLAFNYLTFPLTIEIQKLKVVKKYEMSQSEEIKHIEIKLTKSKNINSKIGEICFQIGEILANDLGIESFAISTILNIREFESFNAKEIIGDCHTTLVIPFYKNETQTDFLQRFDIVFQHYKKGNSPYFSAFNNFPVMSEQEKTLEEVYDTIPIAGINYLGFLNSEDVNEIEIMLKKSKKSLMSFPGKRIYVTVFEDENEKTHAYFLTYPNTNQVGS